MYSVHLICQREKLKFQYNLYEKLRGTSFIALKRCWPSPSPEIGSGFDSSSNSVAFSDLRDYGAVSELQYLILSFERLRPLLCDMIHFRDLLSMHSKYAPRPIIERTHSPKRQNFIVWYVLSDSWVLWYWWPCWLPFVVLFFSLYKPYTHRFTVEFSRSRRLNSFSIETLLKTNTFLSPSVWTVCLTQPHSSVPFDFGV